VGQSMVISSEVAINPIRCAGFSVKHAGQQPLL